MRGPRPNRRYLPKALWLYDMAWSYKTFLFQSAAVAPVQPVELYKKI